MTAIVLTLIAVPSAQASSSGAAVGHRAVSGSAVYRHGEPERVAPDSRCKSARVAAVFYRLRTYTWQTLRDGRLATRTPVVAGKSCHWARYTLRVWVARAKTAERTYWRWFNDKTLQDFAFSPGTRAWPRAVEEVQRVFPGTEGWLLSCSAAEGGHGRWVLFAGRPYYPGSEYARNYTGHLEVGGPMQFTYGTFTGMFRRAVDYVYAHGFRTPQYVDYTAAWRSALGQALAGGWARYTGNDNSHWSASWGNGC